MYVSLAHASEHSELLALMITFITLHWVVSAQKLSSANKMGQHLSGNLWNAIAQAFPKTSKEQQFLPSYFFCHMKYEIGRVLFVPVNCKALGTQT